MNLKPGAPILLAAAILVLTGFWASQTQAQSPPHDLGSSSLLTCSPTPCVLPPTQASEGGAEVADAPIVADPLNPTHLLLGSVDFNCQFGIGFFISSEWRLQLEPHLCNTGDWPLLPV